MGRTSSSVKRKLPSTEENVNVDTVAPKRTRSNKQRDTATASGDLIDTVMETESTEVPTTVRTPRRTRSQKDDQEVDAEAEARQKRRQSLRSASRSRVTTSNAATSPIRRSTSRRRSPTKLALQRNEDEDEERFRPSKSDTRPATHGSLLDAARTPISSTPQRQGSSTGQFIETLQVHSMKQGPLPTAPSSEAQKPATSLIEDLGEGLMRAQTDYSYLEPRVPTGYVITSSRDALQLIDHLFVHIFMIGLLHVFIAAIKVPEFRKQLVTPLNPYWTYPVSIDSILDNMNSNWSFIPISLVILIATSVLFHRSIRSVLLRHMDKSLYDQEYLSGAFIGYASRYIYGLVSLFFIIYYAEYIHETPYLTLKYFYWVNAVYYAFDSVFNCYYRAVASSSAQSTLSFITLSLSLYFAFQPYSNLALNLTTIIRGIHLYLILVNFAEGIKGAAFAHRLVDPKFSWYFSTGLTILLSTLYRLFLAAITLFPLYAVYLERTDSQAAAREAFAEATSNQTATKGSATIIPNVSADVAVEEFIAILVFTVFFGYLSSRDVVKHLLCSVCA